MSLARLKEKLNKIRSRQNDDTTSTFDVSGKVLKPIMFWELFLTGSSYMDVFSLFYPH